VNRRDRSVIWVKAHPLEWAQVDVDLDVVLSHYADGLSGTTLYSQNSLFNIETKTAREYTSFVKDKAPIALGSIAGLAATIELAPSDRLKLDPNFRSDEVRVVFARFGYYEAVPSTEGKSRAQKWVTVQRGHELDYRRAALLVAGYSNGADRFEQHLADFTAMLARISFAPDAVYSSTTALAPAGPLSAQPSAVPPPAAPPATPSGPAGPAGPTPSRPTAGG
jgi:hypothetical protein